MTIEQFLQQNTRYLEAAGVGTARLDVLVLLEDCLNKNRTQLLARPEENITIEQLKWLKPRVARRGKHEPLAYIRGKTEFYGREFIVNKHVLEPRPESETMIDLLKSAVIPVKAGIQSKKNSFKSWVPDQVRNEADSDTDPTIIDVGTGSGALAITAKLELPEATVIGIDIDPKCLKVASANAEMLATEVELIEGDLLNSLAIDFQLQTSVCILANLPYVPNSFHISEAASSEPRIAIFGGKDGLDVYRRMFSQLRAFSWQPDLVLAESMPPQHDILESIAKEAGFTLTRTDDFIQQFEPAKH